MTKFTEQQIENIFQAIGYGVDVDDDLIRTAETIDNFKQARDGYNEKGRMTEGKTGDGLAYIEIENCQAFKGQQRVNLVVVDFGDFRLAAKL